MGQKKLLRFNQIKSFPNVYEYPTDSAGTWRTRMGNAYPIVLELACGRGEYTVGLAAMFPDQQFIGVDVKGNRMYMGAKKALEKPLPNAAFLRTQIEMINNYFAPSEVDEIWITFPDPQLRTSRSKKRLTHPRFLRLYQQFLKPGGLIHLKTDSPDLFRFTMLVINMYGLQLIEHSEDVYAQDKPDPRLLIKTHYEGLDIARSSRIFYICFTLPDFIDNHDDRLQEALKLTEKKEGD
jgi:tRNA (guanine-N7-)-methyltransferase